jgi:hypothetical protein
MQSLFFLLLSSCKKIISKTLLLSIISVGCINMINTYQCYACDNRLKDGCGDPFNARSMTDMEKSEVPSGGVCIVWEIFFLMVRTINFYIPENKIFIKKRSGRASYVDMGCLTLQRRHKWLRDNNNNRKCHWKLLLLYIEPLQWCIITTTTTPPCFYHHGHTFHTHKSIVLKRNENFYSLLKD